MNKTYLKKLGKLEALCVSIPNTRMLVQAKIQVLIILNMRYEMIMLDRNLDKNPYILVEGFVEHAISNLEAWQEIAFIEEPNKEYVAPDQSQEGMHRDLFQMLWTKFDINSYKERIKRFEHRLQVNGIEGAALDGKRVIDFGCGHGNFDHSFLNCGAAFVLGIDYGEESIAYALASKEKLGVNNTNLQFKVASVYETGEPDESFDMAVQNGVFHHLEDEDRAYREVRRVLKPGGICWFYTDGEGGISYDLWDASRRALANIPPNLVAETTASLNISEGKQYHIGDGLNAVYRHTSWDEITTRLEKIGFGEFKRLIGGFETDMDLDVIERDPWGKEKFGEGDIRFLCRKMD